MNEQLIAIRDGKYDEAIRLANNKLVENEDDISSHFTLAQAYESKGEFEAALSHAKRCAEFEPPIFESLSLAARCAAKLENYDTAYKYAKKALLDSNDPNLPKAVQVLFKFLSVLPGLRGLKNINEQAVGTYSGQTQWLRDFVGWYERKTPNKAL